MTGRLTYASALLILTFVATGCESNRDADHRVLEDALGRTVRIPDSIGRVVTLAPNLTEMVFVAGAGHKLVGVGRPDDYPPQIDTLPRYSVYPVDFEAVAALQPDLVLASDQVNARRDAETLGALDVPTFFLASTNVDDVLNGILTTGELLGTETEARAAVDSLRARIDALVRRTNDVADRPLTLFLIGEDVLFSFGRESYMHELIDLAGGRSATGDLAVDAPVLSEEFVLSIRPEVIIGPWGDDYDAARLLEHHPTWDVLPAIRNDRVYGVDAAVVERPGPRLVEGAWEMARRIHPELFEDGTEDQ